MFTFVGYNEFHNTTAKWDIAGCYTHKKLRSLTLFSFVDSYETYELILKLSKLTHDIIQQTHDIIQQTHDIIQQ